MIQTNPTSSGNLNNTASGFSFDSFFGTVTKLAGAATGVISAIRSKPGAADSGEAQRLLAEQEKARLAGAASPNNKWPWFAGIGVGALVLVGLVFALVRKGKG